MPTIHRVTIEQTGVGLRLDKFLAQALADLTRSYIQTLFNEGLIKVNDNLVKASYKVRSGDQVVLTCPDPLALTVQPEKITLDIYFEDSDLIVVNKPAGMTVHPAKNNYSGTLVNALLYHCQDLSGINGVMRPGIVHRIDKDTTGLLVVAKNDLAHLALARQFKNHSVIRYYQALVHGNIQNQGGIIDAPVGRDHQDRQKMTVTANNSKNAVTHFKVKQRLGRYTLVTCQLETGRTHQIRVHMSYIKHPVVGDAKYGGKTKEFNLTGQLLHAAVLGFEHPRSGEQLEFTAPLPPHFQAVLDKL